MDKSNVIEAINNLDINTKLQLPDSFPYICVDFDMDKHSGEFSWSLENKNRPGWTYPMKNSNYVKYFKTLAGAKRNLIKHIKWILEDSRYE